MNSTARKLLLSPQGIVRNGLIAEYRFNEGAGQILYDYKNNNNGQLGSTAGADTNDPTWTTQGLTFATDDYCVMPVPFDVNGDWTVCLVVKRDGIPAGGEYFYSIGNSTTDTPNIAFLNDVVANRVIMRVGNDAGNAAYPTLANNNVGFNLFCLKKENNIFRVKNVGTQTFVVTSVSGIFTLNRCTLGAFARVNIAAYLNGEIAYYMPYSRATSDAEDMQNYRHLKKILAGRGVAI